MKKTTIGKFRGLQRCSNSRGGFSILALDHRKNLRKAINPESPDQVPYMDLVDFKLDVTQSLANQSSAVLLDPEYGAFQAIASGILPGDTGLIVALEATGYSSDPSARQTKILEGWNVQKAKLMGADAVKLLVYYNPNSKEADEIEKLVHKVALDCESYDTLFILELLIYSTNSNEDKVTGFDRKDLIIQSSRKLSNIGGDILKVEFPLDIDLFPDKADWALACSELSNCIEIPWVLLSASVDFKVFIDQVEIACRNGASGIAVGRAVWKEAIGVERKDRRRILDILSHSRMQELSVLVDERAKPYKSFYYLPEIDDLTYKFYR